MPKMVDIELGELRKLRPEPFTLRIPMLNSGMSRDLLCSGENSTFRIHCYSTGMGEKHGFHAHIEEEHVFVVLHGQAVFSGLDGKLPITAKNEGVWLPKGCFYEFVNPGPEPLVVLRFGAQDADANASLRLTPEGDPIRGRSSANPDLAKPDPIQGRFFE